MSTIRTTQKLCRARWGELLRSVRKREKVASTLRKQLDEVEKELKRYRRDLVANSGARSGGRKHDLLKQLVDDALERKEAIEKSLEAIGLEISHLKEGTKAYKAVVAFEVEGVGTVMFAEKTGPANKTQTVSYILRNVWPDGLKPGQIRESLSDLFGIEVSSNHLNGILGRLCARGEVARQDRHYVYVMGDKNIERTADDLGVVDGTESIN